MDLLIFDLDGTLIDSRLDLAHAVNATRSHMRMEPIEHERVYSYVGSGAPVLIRRALGDGATEAQVQEALEYFLEYYREHYLDYTTLWEDHTLYFVEGTLRQALHEGGFSVVDFQCYRAPYENALVAIGPNSAHAHVQ